MSVVLFIFNLTKVKQQAQAQTAPKFSTVSFSEELREVFFFCYQVAVLPVSVLAVESLKRTHQVTHVLDHLGGLGAGLFQGLVVFLLFHQRRVRRDLKSCRDMSLTL